MRSDAAARGGVADVPAGEGGAAVPAPPAPPAPAAPTLTKRASLNALQSLLDYGARLGVGLVVTPIVVEGLGRSLFGVWEMIGRLIGYMSAADGRPTEALRLLIATKQGADDPMEHRRAVGSALVVWLWFLPLVAGVGALLVWLSPIVTKVPASLQTTVRLASVALVLSLLVGGLASIPESVLRGMNLGYRRMGFQAGLNLIGGVLTASAVYAGLGLVGLAGAQVVLIAVTGLCFWVLVKHYVPSFGMARPAPGDVRSLLGMSGWIAIGEVIAKLALASDVIILGMVVSPAVVTTYVLTGYAGRIALGLHAFTVGAAMPGLGGVIGRGDHRGGACAHAAARHRGRVPRSTGGSLGPDDRLSAAGGRMPPPAGAPASPRDRPPTGGDGTGVRRRRLARRPPARASLVGVDRRGHSDACVDAGHRLRGRAVAPGPPRGARPLARDGGDDPWLVTRRVGKECRSRWAPDH